MGPLGIYVEAEESIENHYIFGIIRTKGLLVSVSLSLSDSGEGTVVRWGVFSK